jgi:DNA-binding NarL/FixJ family response regulator
LVALILSRHHIASENAMDAVTIFIADDHRVVIEGVKSALNGYAEFEIIGEATTGEGAVESVRQLEPEIVILDISMPDLDGVEVTRRIKAIAPETRIIIFTMHSDKEFVVNLFKAGISAYVLKDDPVSDLILAIKAVQGGGTYFSTMAPTILVRHMEELEKRKGIAIGVDTLSRREHEIFQLLADGNSVKVIAKRLFISPKTVETHKYHIMEKLNAKSLTDLTKIAIRKNLIEI